MMYKYFPQKIALYGIRIAQFFEGNIDGQHLTFVLAILLEIVERENFDGLLV